MPPAGRRAESAVDLSMRCPHARCVMKNLIVAISLAGAACTHHPAQDANSEQAQRSQQQVIVDRSTSAIKRLRAQPRFAAMERLLAEAKAVLVFPKLIKASLIVGGEGGNGVMLARGQDGSWSSPAFYSLGAPSLGLQAGFRESTAVVFVMNETTMERLLHSSMTLGAQTSVTLGEVGERGLTEGDMLRKDIYVLTEAGGAFAGVSLDGYVIGTRKAHNELYYGKGATARTILLSREHKNAASNDLQDALRVQPGAEAVQEDPTPIEPAPVKPAQDPQQATEATTASAVSPLPAGYRACSPESRQVERCKDEQAPVCAQVADSWRTFPNACEACRDGVVAGYAPTACSPQAAPVTP